jgi:hypothetical protein
MINDAPALWQEVKFRKSSFSGSNGGDCVELAWRKSSFSGGNGGDCVEVAQAPAMFGIRDSKHADGPVLALPAGQARVFLAAVKQQR